MGLIKLIVIAPVVVTLFGCMSAPKNPDEFIANIQRSLMLVTNETETVNTSFSEAKKILSNKVKPCLNGRVVTTTQVMVNGGYATTKNRKDWNVTQKDVADNHSRMSLQIDYLDSSPPVMGEIPKGGMYVAVIDVMKKDKSSVDVNYFLQNNVKDDVYQPVRDFLAGKEGECKFNS